MLAVPHFTMVSDTYFYTENENPTANRRNSWFIYRQELCSKQFILTTYSINLLWYLYIYLEGKENCEEENNTCCNLPHSSVQYATSETTAYCLSNSNRERRSRMWKIRFLSMKANKHRSQNKALVWLQGLGAKNRTKPYFKNSRKLFNKGPIREEEN